MYLFTWNLNKKDDYQPELCLHLERMSKQQSVLCALQEWPPSVPKGFVGSGLKFVTGSDHVVIVHSKDLNLVSSEFDKSGRAQIVEMETPTGARMKCVGVHWHSRDSRGGVEDAAERGALMALFRHHLDLQVSPSGPASSVLLGDLNCSPEQSEFASQYCLFGLSITGRTVPGMQTLMGQTKAPWYLIAPRIEPDLGTYFWKKSQRWHNLDHVLVSDALRTRVASCEVLCEIEGERLITNKKRTPKGAAPDHLPVACSLHFQ